MPKRVMSWSLCGLVVVASACVATRSDNAIDRPEIVMRFERDGPRVNEDRKLADDWAGDLVIEARTAQAAYCVNGFDWVEDVTLNTIILVSTTPRLVRAAELVADGEDVDMATAVEVELLAAGRSGVPSIDDLSDEVRERWGESALAAYLEATAEPPSVEAARRFVVYAASWSTYGQYITFVDLARADRDAIERFARMPDLGVDDILIAGGQAPVPMNSRDCDELELL